LKAAHARFTLSFKPNPSTPLGLLGQALGAECWLKRETHTPVGTFKIRGGRTYFEHLRCNGALHREVISATRGNHGSAHWLGCACARREVLRRGAARQLGREKSGHARSGHHLD
jgi:threonine dehydratase